MNQTIRPRVGLPINGTIDAPERGDAMLRYLPCLLSNKPILMRRCRETDSMWEGIIGGSLAHFASQRRNLRRPIRGGVTIVEVLFAMFVVLFGLVGLVVLLPLAGRNAGDSYMMTQGGAMMENTAAELFSSKEFAPSFERGWWYADDRLAPLNYNVAYSLGSLYQNLQTSIRANRGFPTLPQPMTQVQIQQVVRESYAYGFCIDPLFCADQFSTGWRYATMYTSQRKSATQVLFRRTRMPFFDEHCFRRLDTATGLYDFEDVLTNPPGIVPISPVLFPSSVVEFPRLVRVSYPSEIVIGQPLPMPTSMAEKLVSSMGDLVQAEPTEDKSYGSLRGFQGSASGAIRSPTNANITWLMTMTPSEQTHVGEAPSMFDVSFVVMNRRDRTFDAAPLSVTGAEKYPEGEKIAFATSAIGNNLVAPFWETGGPYSLADLPGSTTGVFEMKLWGVELTDPTVRVGDWVMLSRKLSLGDALNANYNPKLIHRHRWYRVIGVDARETWPRVIRVSGDPWDYPEVIPGGNNGFDSTNLSHLVSALTTVTICRSVEMVYSKVVSLD